MGRQQNAQLQVHLTTPKPSNKRAILKLKYYFGEVVKRTETEAKEREEGRQGCEAEEKQRRYLSKLNRDYGMEKGGPLPAQNGSASKWK